VLNHWAVPQASDILLAIEAADTSIRGTSATSLSVSRAMRYSSSVGIAYAVSGCVAEEVERQPGCGVTASLQLPHVGGARQSL
jgi:hypothetical protein